MPKIQCSDSLLLPHPRKTKLVDCRYGHHNFDDDVTAVYGRQDNFKSLTFDVAQASVQHGVPQGGVPGELQLVHKRKHGCRAFLCL